MIGRIRFCAALLSWLGFPFGLKPARAAHIGVHKERVGVMLFFTFTKVLNHFQPSNPIFSLTSPITFGQITGQSNTPRNMEFRLRFRFEES